MPSQILIQKWHVYICDMNPAWGTEPGKIRPIVVVQSNMLNSFHPSTVICPITSHVQSRASHLRVHLRRGEGGLEEASDILVDQIRAIDNRRFVRHLGQISRRNRLLLQENLITILS